MPIGPMDEYLAHQTTETFDYVQTSDRNFYDRYYFNMHDSTGDFFMVAGMGQYPNLGVLDAFVAISVGTKQYVVRASRALGHDRLDTQVGPFRIEVLEGLQSLRLQCDKNEWGLHFDLRFDGTIPALEEPRTFTRKGSRVRMDVSRYAQVGCYTGSLEVDGQTHEVTPDRWKGARDRSWGIRPVGEREPAGIGIEEVMQGKHGFYHHWIPLQLDRGMVKVMYEADYEGTVTVEEAAFIPAFGEGDSRGEIEKFGIPKIEVDYLSGTREMAAATTTLSPLPTLSAPSPNDVLTIRSLPQRTVYLAAGTGYLPTDEWGHGFYKGPLVVEGLSFDMSTQAQRSQYAILNETLCRFELSTGEISYGMHENMCIGVYQPHGFNEPGTQAP
ncbi:MAG: hypothetical protein ABGX04_03075 [Myxococcales bacterium]|nr:hypothetical protein [Myxococcales bacterium]HIK85724.1 hypothetical protein [Myxococcales bacterium]